MNRQEKHPETATFHFYNANPKNKITTDCVVRAISAATEKPYRQVVMELAEMQCKCGYDSCDVKLYGKYLESLGWKKYKQPRKGNGKKYTGEEFCKVLQEWLDFDETIHCSEWDDGIIIAPRIISHIGGHHLVAIIDGKVWDTWNSTDGCIGNYWIKI